MRIVPFGLALLVGLANAAQADAPRRSALNWVRASGAEACIDPRALSERVQALTGPVLVAAVDADVSIEGEIAPLREAGFRTRITITDRRGAVIGERLLELPADDCRALDPTLAFVIAVMIDPDVTLPPELARLVSSEEAPEEALLAELSANPPKPVALASRAAAPETSPPVAPEPTPPPALAARSSNELHAGLGAVWGSAPGTALTATLSLLHSFGRYVWFGGSLRALPPLREQPLEPGLSVTVQAYDAALQGCLGRWFGERTLTRLCAGPEFNVWAARGNGFDESEAGTLYGVGLSLSPQLRIDLARGVGLRLDSFARLNLREQRFLYTSAQGDEKTAFRVARASLGITLGPTFAF